MKKIFIFLLFLLINSTIYAQNNNPKIYIPYDSENEKIKILDAQTLKEIDNIPIPDGQYPNTLVLRDDKKIAFVANNAAFINGILIVDLIQKTIIKSILTDQLVDAIYKGPNGFIYALLGSTKELAIINPNTFLVAKRIPFPQRVSTLVFAKNGVDAYLVGLETGTFALGKLFKINLNTLLITNSLDLPPGISGLNGAVLSADEKLLYITRIRLISVVDLNNFEIVRSIPATDFAYGLQISNDGKTLYEIDFSQLPPNGDPRLLIINISTREIIKQFKLMLGTRFINLSPNGKILYVNSFFDGYFLLDTTTNTIIKTVAPMEKGFGEVLTLDGDFISTTPPTINTQSPKAGDVIQRNKPYTIKWQTTPGQATPGIHNIDISFDGGKTFSSIVQGLDGNIQQFDWTPNKNTVGAQLRITVIDYLGNSASSLSGTFSISDNAPPPPMDTQAPTVRFLNPLGGETFAPGDNLMITWSSTDNVGVTNQDLSLSTDGGATFPITIANGLTGSTQSFSYSLPSTLQTNSGRLRLVVRDAAGNSAQTVTPANFNVQAPIDTQAPVVTIAQPSNTNNIFSAGQAINVQWQSVDNVAVATQSLLLSLDNGQSFQTLSMFDGTTNSFVINNIDKFATQAVVKITATDAAGNKGEKTANFQVAPMLSQAIYTKPLLNITGVGFNNATNNQAGSVRVFINNKEATKGIVTVNSNLSIRVKGNKKKLGLVKGNNSLMLVVNGLNSNSVNFTF